MGRLVEDGLNHVLDEVVDRQYTADHCRCWPPPLFIVSITLLEFGFFVYNTTAGDAAGGGVTSLTALTSRPTSLGAVSLDSVLLYRADRRWQLWRFVTYAVLHASWWHLIFNLLVQLAAGLPLEMVHGSGRVLTIYLAGVLAGSLGTSVCDTSRQVYLVGASGGVYALLTAHIANVLLNHRQLRLGLARLTAVTATVGCDAGLAVYRRHALTPPSEPTVSGAAHLAAALAGLVVGLVALRNFAPKPHESLLWWLALGFCLACTLWAALVNVLPAPGELYV